MITHKYFRSHYDSCVYFKTLLSRRGIYLLLYVDGMLIAYKQIEEIEKLKNELSYKFEIKNIGCAIRIWSMQIVRIKNSKTLFHIQADYIEKILKRFKIINAKPMSIPLSAHFWFRV